MPLLLDRLAGRSRAGLPAPAWSALRTLRSVTGAGPLVGLPAYRRALVVAPHPDDETVGCGGTLALLARSGCHVTAVVVTDGEATPGTGLAGGEIARRRAAEVAQACGVLGLSGPVRLGLPDGALTGVEDRLVGLLEAELVRARPQLVLAPWAGDGHDDHRAVLGALLRCPSLDGVAVWGYETWSPLPWPNRVVDVTGVTGTKTAALACHATAARSIDLDAMLALDRYRSLSGLAGRGTAEAFLELPAARHSQVLAAVRTPAA